jgi:hypothetical protein
LPGMPSVDSSTQGGPVLGQLSLSAFEPTETIDKMGGCTGAGPLRKGSSVKPACLEATTDARLGGTLVIGGIGVGSEVGISPLMVPGRVVMTPVGTTNCSPVFTIFSFFVFLGTGFVPRRGRTESPQKHSDASGTGRPNGAQSWGLRGARDSVVSAELPPRWPEP